MLVREDPLALDEQRAHLWLPDNVPPVLAVLNDILNHLVVVALKLVIFLVRQYSQILHTIVQCEHLKILINLLKYLLNLEYLLDVDLYIL